MLNTLRHKVIELPDEQFNSNVILLTPVEVADASGRITRKSEFKPFDIAGSLEPFKASDFSISSLESVGALGKLQTTYMSYTSNMNVADSFENLTLEQNVPQS